MRSKLIGFVGITKCDILLYMSQILRELDQRVMIVDLSENQSIICSIPIPKDSKTHKEGASKFDFGKYDLVFVREVEEYAVPCNQPYITYAGIDFFTSISYKYLEQLGSEYDYIFIDYGLHYKKKENIKHDKIFIYLDQQIHNIEACKDYRTWEFQEIFLLFRHLYNCKISCEYVLHVLDLELDEDKIYEYEYDLVDLKCSIDNQYNYNSNFLRISHGLKDCLKYMIHTMLPGLTKEELKSAYRSATMKRRFT